jgi:hypothetical protein
MSSCTPSTTSIITHTSKPPVPENKKATAVWCGRSVRSIEQKATQVPKALIGHICTACRSQKPCSQETAHLYYYPSKNSRFPDWKKTCITCSNKRSERRKRRRSSFLKEESESSKLKRLQKKYAELSEKYKALKTAVKQERLLAPELSIFCKPIIETTNPPPTFTAEELNALFLTPDESIDYLINMPLEELKRTAEDYSSPLLSLEDL